jgi:hypothetical protein
MAYVNNKDRCEYTFGLIGKNDYVVGHDSLHQNTEPFKLEMKVAYLDTSEYSSEFVLYGLLDLRSVPGNELQNEIGADKLYRIYNLETGKRVMPEKGFCNGTGEEGDELYVYDMNFRFLKEINGIVYEVLLALLNIIGKIHGFTFIQPTTVSEHMPFRWTWPDVNKIINY